MRFIFFVLVIAGAVIWWERPSSQELNVMAKSAGDIFTPPPLSPHGGAPQVQGLSAGIGRSSALAPPKFPKDLFTKLNSAQSYRAFLFDAIKYPDLGGYMYAYAALGKCKEVAH